MYVNFSKAVGLYITVVVMK